MYDRTRQHASTTTDRPRRQRSLTPRGLAATVLLLAVVPAAAWAVSHPATAATLAVAAAAAYAGVRFARARVTVRPASPRAAVGAALATFDRDDGE